MIDLKGNPFYLSDEQVKWVRDTLSSLTEEEKIGQLFCPISYSADEGYLRGALLRHRTRQGRKRVNADDPLM